jgi:hypothetical protein
MRKSETKYNIATLRLLKERVEKATGPDWGTDYLLLEILGPSDEQEFPPRYTDSLDACVSLAEQEEGR